MLSREDRALLNVGTQDAIALLFKKQMAGKMLYDHTRGQWLEWDGTAAISPRAESAECLADTRALCRGWSSRSAHAEHSGYIFDRFSSRLRRHNRGCHFREDNGREAVPGATSGSVRGGHPISLHIPSHT
jgi:hypothetical protein